MLGVVGVEPVEQRGASAITARVPAWSASKARSGFWSSALADLVGQLVLARAQVGASARRGRPPASRAMPRLDRRSRAGTAAGALEQLGQQEDQLGVERGVVGAERLGADLGELAEAAGLRRLVAEERAPGTRPSPAAASLCMPCST